MLGSGDAADAVPDPVDAKDDAEPKEHASRDHLREEGNGKVSKEENNQRVDGKEEGEGLTASAKLVRRDGEGHDEIPGDCASKSATHALNPRHPHLAIDVDM